MPPSKNKALLLLTTLIFIFNFSSIETISKEKKKCPRTFVLSETCTCTCPSGTKPDKKRRKCLPFVQPVPTPLSEPPSSCPNGTTLDTFFNKCVPPPLTNSCQYDERIPDPSGGDCICPPFVGKQPKLFQIFDIAIKSEKCSCKKPAVHYRGGCKCPEGTIYQGIDGCVDIQKVELPICELNQTTGGLLNYCKCGEGATVDEVGRCKCKEGKVYFGKKGCVDLNSPEIPKCKGSVLATNCICSESALIGDGGQCECQNGLIYVGGEEGCKNACAEGTGPTKDNSCVCAPSAEVNSEGICQCNIGVDYRTKGICIPGPTNPYCKRCKYRSTGCSDCLVRC